MDDIEIRAAAAQAAGQYMGAMGGGAFEDFLFSADMVEAYIRSGSDAALKYYQDAVAAQQAEGVTQEVELREPSAGVQRSEVVDAPVAESPAPVKPAEVPTEVQRETPPQQNAARRLIEKGRHDRAMGLVRQAKVAKVEAHKKKLIEEADNSGLSDQVVVIEDKPIRLGDYLRSR